MEDKEIARGIERCRELIRESRELIEKSEALLQEGQRLSETPKLTYLRRHLKRVWSQSSPPCYSPPLTERVPHST